MTARPAFWYKARVRFEILGDLPRRRTIAVGRRIRELRRLRRAYGPGRWRKMKGIAEVLLPDGTIARAEVHRYEGHGIGRVELKLKRLLSDQS